jgi:hypothetical protein
VIGEVIGTAGIGIVSAVSAVSVVSAVSAVGCCGWCGYRSAPYIHGATPTNSGILFVSLLVLK